VLLDTHVWVWSGAGDRNAVGARTRRALERARARGELFISVVSMFEIAALHVIGRLELTSSPEEWVRESIETAGLKVLDVAGAIALEAGAIPVTALADPCDRLLAASARHRSLPLVTRDARILDYGLRSRRVRVLDASQ
jgi:PIN domain nuclease of toxin-antitoxin system